MGDSEGNFRAVQIALNAASSSINKHRYASAMMHLSAATKAIPKGYARSDFASAYASAINDIKSMVTSVSHGLSGEIERMYKGGYTRPLARKTIEQLEQYSKEFKTSGIHPIKEIARSEYSRVPALKTQLEKLAKSKGQTVEWGKK